MIRIGIDVSACAKPRGYGIPHYIHHLLAELAKLDTTDVFYAYYRASRILSAKYIRVPAQSNFHRRPFFELIGQLFGASVQVFHGPDARIPRLPGVKTVVTIHDLMALREDRFSDLAFRQKKQARYHEIADHADRIIATTNTNRAEIVATLGVDERRVVTIYQGFSDTFRPQPPQEIDRVRQKYRLPALYLLSTAGLSRRKNTLAILKVVRRLSQGDPAIKLVLTGQKSYQWEESASLLEEMVEQGVVRYLGFVPDADMPAVMAGARLLLFPSLYEGFGHPVLEAMSCGVPVVTSNAGSLPEVAGGAAVLVDPTNLDDIAAATSQILTDERARTELVARGFARAAQFSWARTAQETLRLYRELAGE